MVVERLRDEGAAGHDFDQCAQDVGGASVHRAHVDRIHAKDDRQHAEAGDRVRLSGQPLEWIGNVNVDSQKSLGTRSRSLLHIELVATHRRG